MVRALGMKMLLYTHKCELPPEDDIVVKYIDSGFAVFFRRSLKRLLIVDASSTRSMSFLKSQTAIRYEQQRNLQFYYSTIHPFSFFRRRWEEAMAIVISLTLSIVPLQVSSFELYKFFRPIWVVVDFLFVMDIVLNFYTGHLNRQTRKIILDKKYIAKRYLYTFFIPDLIACINEYILVWLFQVYDFRFTKRSFCFAKLSKIITLIRYMETIREDWQISNYKFKIVNLSLISIIALLWFGAAFFMIALIHEEKWLPVEARDSLKGFLMCYYRSINCFFLLGNAIESQYEISIVVEMFSMGIGLIFYLIVMAQILQIVNKYNSSANKYYQITQEMGEYMNYKRLPESIRSRMYEYFVFRFQKNFYREAEIMSTISIQLQEEVIAKMCRGALESVPIFRDLPSTLLIGIAKGMKSETYLQNDIIVYANTHGDSMYFLTSGTVAIYTCYGKEVAHLADGSYFGEIYLVLENEKRVATVIATEPCELFNLPRREFLKAVNMYPHFFERIKTLAKERLQKTLEQISQLETLSRNTVQQELLEKYQQPFAV